jgi:diacylglycerol kinase
MGTHYLRNKTFNRSLRCATRGLIVALLNEPNLRRQVLMGLLIAVLTWFLGLPLWQIIVLMLVAVNVLAFELANSALEVSLDVLHPDYHEGIERAKDIAAAAVLLVSIVAAILGIVFLTDPLINKITDWLI